MKTYTIQRGDTLFKIAKQCYGDGELYGLLAAYNNISANALEVGQTLNIPTLEELKASSNPLSMWHNYPPGTIYWRVTAQGVDVRGKGIVKTPQFTKQTARIWQNYQTLLVAASKKYGVPVPVLIATISTESSGKPDGKRYEDQFYSRYIKDQERWKNNPYYKFPERISSSYGLVQIMYTTAYDVGFRGAPEDLLDPAKNIDAGAAFIASNSQKKEHGWDPPKIACAYNAGRVRKTTENDWGMHCYGNHLDRWVPSYNGTVEVIGSAYAAPPAAPVTPPAPKPTPKPEPPKPTAPSAAIPKKDRSTLHFIFPKDAGVTWKPMVIDLFRHTSEGLDDPISYTVSSPTSAPDGGYACDIPEVARGVYDFVFSDAGSGAILADLSEYDVDEPLETLDVRQSVKAASPAAAQFSTVRFTFATQTGQAWKPLIIDMFTHKADSLSAPVSYLIKTPARSPEGETIYDLPNLAKGIYDFIFSDAGSGSVVQSITDYVVDEAIERIDLGSSRSLWFMAPPTAPTGIRAIIKDIAQKLVSKL